MTITNAIVLFCDDIRHEKEEKTTYVGVSSSETSELEADSFMVVDKICVAAFLQWHKDSPPVGSTFQVRFPNGEIAAPFHLPPENYKELPADPETGIIGISIHTVIAPLIVSGGSKLCAELSFEGKVTQIGSFKFLTADNNKIKKEEDLKRSKRKRRTAVTRNSDTIS